MMVDTHHRDLLVKEDGSTSNRNHLPDDKEEMVWEVKWSENHLSNYMSCSAMEVLHVACKESRQISLLTLIRIPLPTPPQMGRDTEANGTCINPFSKKEKGMYSFQEEAHEDESVNL